MNKTDVIVKVSEKSGIASTTCEKIINAFEEQTGEALIGKFKGNKNDRADILTGIVDKTRFSLEECEKVLTAFEDVFGTELSAKLRFLK